MNTVICISRQFASGGHEIGKILSKRFNIPLYDREIIIECAEKHGISKGFIHSHDEKTSYSLRHSIAREYFGNHDLETPGGAMFQAQAEVIREFAQKGPCIIIGRCGGEVLWDLPNCQRIFIYANKDFRLKRTIERYGCDPKEAWIILQQKDRERTTYYTRYADNQWGSINSFDLAVSTSCCGIDGAVNVIFSYLEQCENK